jgi:hypothetical protein
MCWFSCESIAMRLLMTPLGPKEYAEPPQSEFATVHTGGPTEPSGAGGLADSAPLTQGGRSCLDSQLYMEGRETTGTARRHPPDTHTHTPRTPRAGIPSLPTWAAV